jgi:hypothetical protein
VRRQRAPQIGLQEQILNSVSEQFYDLIQKCDIVFGLIDIVRGDGVSGSFGYMYLVCLFVSFDAVDAKSWLCIG